MVKKCVIGLQNLAFRLPEENPNKVGVDQTLDLSAAFCEIAVEDREDNLVSGRMRWMDLTLPEGRGDCSAQKSAPEFRMSGRSQPCEKEYVRKDGKENR
jgi:hypothetical protein